MTEEVRSSLFHLLLVPIPGVGVFALHRILMATVLRGKSSSRLLEAKVWNRDLAIYLVSVAAMPLISIIGSGRSEPSLFVNVPYFASLLVSLIGPSVLAGRLYYGVAAPSHRDWKSLIHMLIAVLLGILVLILVYGTWTWVFYTYVHSLGRSGQ